MIRFYPMARAVPLLGGNPVVYDLMQVSSLTRCVPAYPPIVRDLETVGRVLRRKNFGSRPTAELAFEIAHSRTLNVLARYEEVGVPLIVNRWALDSAPWAAVGATVALSTARDPDGLYQAWRITDADAVNTGRIQIVGMAGVARAILSCFYRADSNHIASVAFSAATSPETAFGTSPTWRRREVRLDQATDPTHAITAQVNAFALADTAALGNVDVYAPDMREIVPVAGTDEEILSDLYDKMCSDDWRVEMTLDGGLVWRTVLLQEYEKQPVEEKWIGHAVSLVVECADPVSSRPPTLDGRW